MVKWLELAQDKMVSLWTCIIPTSPHHCFQSVCADSVSFQELLFTCMHHRARLQELVPLRAAVGAGTTEHNPKSWFSRSPLWVPGMEVRFHVRQQVLLSDCNSVLSDSSVKVQETVYRGWQHVLPGSLRCSPGAIRARTAGCHLSLSHIAHGALRGGLGVLPI